MLKLVYAVLLGLVGAAIVHLVVLFMLPAYSERDIWSRLSAVAAPYAVVQLDSDALGEPAATQNPFLVATACRFDLGDGPVHVRSSGAVPFWSLSIYDDNGLNVFSVSDRAGSGSALDFVALNSAQMQQVRSGVPDELGRSVFVETSAEKGIVLVRVFLPDDTWRGVVDAFLGDLSCRPVALDESL
ncbi:DUF1254 domain-containing protein [Chelativorans sp. AA-79]|uniref:DUF1254 domain-containing protein n=1 Tax=Chelativorans sp. AA-79 TaxID=3028735 RepID=UPI0023F9B266|nr:DUF1254 domain-containing protein [Chelativorans sp. AA-79]WEX07742.1 DUF1254 domain-containing protein [Chelativorans sp. AA-79]